MKIVTAIDSFKGSMTSMEAGQAAAEGIHRVDADAEVIVRPLADGGRYSRGTGIRDEWNITESTGDRTTWRTGDL